MRRPTERPRAERPAGRLPLSPRGRWRRSIYALWPAGVAMSSVVGTDVPAAALIVGGARAPGDARPGATLDGGAGVRRGDGAGGLGARGGAAAVGALARLLAGAAASPRPRAPADGGGAGRGAGGALALGDPASAAERLALLHRRPRRDHRAHRREPELRGDVHARAQSDVQGRHRTERARRAAPHDRSGGLRDCPRVDPVRAALHAGDDHAQGGAAVRSRDPAALLADLSDRRAGRSAGGLVRRASRRRSRRSPTRSGWR